MCKMDDMEKAGDTWDLTPELLKSQEHNSPVGHQKSYLRVFIRPSRKLFFSRLYKKSFLMVVLYKENSNYKLSITGKFC